jgi:hypothetical protein
MAIPMGARGCMGMGSRELMVQMGVEDSHVGVGFQFRLKSERKISPMPDAIFELPG